MRSRSASDRSDKSSIGERQGRCRRGRPHTLLLSQWSGGPIYPTSSQKARRNLASRARKDLDRLGKDGEARIVKGRLMPPKPRE